MKQWLTGLEWRGREGEIGELLIKGYKASALQDVYVLRIAVQHCAYCIVHLNICQENRSHYHNKKKKERG